MQVMRLGNLMRIGSKAAISATALAMLSAAAFADSGKTVTFQNDTNAAIVKLQARATGTKVWPADAIKQVPLGVKKARPLTLAMAAACKYDLFLTFDDGRQLILQAVDVCGKPPVSIKQPAD